MNISREELIKFQDGVMKTALEILSEDEGVQSIAFVILPRMEIDEYLRSISMSIQDWKPMEDDGTAPTALASLIIPVSYTDPDTLAGMALYLGRDPRAATQMLAEMASACGVDRPSKIVVKVFKERFAVDEKDIVAAFLRKMCRGAEAIVRVDEVWIKRLGEYVGDLEKDPQATEALMSILEGKSFVRSLMRGFARSERGTGRVLSMDPPMEEIDDFATSEVHIEGRFIGLLPGWAEKTRARGKTG